MSTCDAVGHLAGMIWPLPVLYLLGLAASSYVLPLIRPREWGSDAVCMCAWFWPVGVWFLIQGRMYQAGQDAQYRHADEKRVMQIVERTRKPSRAWGDNVYWNEYRDNARGMVVRWREE